MQSAFEDLLLEQVRVSQQVDRIQKEQSTLLTLAMNGGVLIPENKLLRMQYADMMLSPDYSYDGSREWGGVLRKVMREHPEFNT